MFLSNVNHPARHIYECGVFSPSLRAKYGTSDLKNALHGSDSFHAAEREIKFMFPNSKYHTYSHIRLFVKKCIIEHSWLCTPTCFLSVAVIEPFPSREATEEYLSRYVNPTLLQGLIELCKQKPRNPCVSIHCLIFENKQVVRFICFGRLFTVIECYGKCLFDGVELWSLEHLNPLPYTFVFTRFGWLTGWSKQSKHASNMRWGHRRRSRMTTWKGWRNLSFPMLFCRKQNKFCVLWKSKNVFFALIICFNCFLPKLLKLSNMRSFLTLKVVTWFKTFIENQNQKVCLSTFII